MLERDIVAKIKKRLKRIDGAFFFKVHGSASQRAGIPDLFFTCEALEGRAVWFEVKRPGKKPTALQRSTIERLNRIGCYAWSVCSVEDVENHLRVVGVI